MLKKCSLVAAILLAAATGTLVVHGQAPKRVLAPGDWPEMRGVNRDGVSPETGLLSTWKLNGENFLWRVPYGGRSAPIVMGNHLYLQNPSGRGVELQERVMALDTDTGKVVWEYKFNDFQSDVPPHRIAWASPAADPETGNIYALSGGAQVIALSPAGKLLWSRSFGEEWAAFTTHGGRTMSPLIDGDLVIVSAAVSNWGTASNRSHRLIGLDKRTGEVVYVANPGGRPYDTAYASPLIATINGMRELIVGLGDGGVHAIKPQTGERVWSFAASKRAINTGVAVSGNTVFMSHGDENLEGTQLGLIAAIDGSQTGDIKTTKWAVRGIEFAYSPPILDGKRLYQLDGGSTLMAFDTETGKELWTLRLGTAQKAPPVFADGKIYVGNDNGEFFIVRPGADKGEILSRVQLPVSVKSCCGSEGTPEQILAGAAVSRGRVFFVSSDAVYAIGSRQAVTPRAMAPLISDTFGARGTTAAPATYVQVVPTELVMEPGQSVKMRARLFDAQGNFLREEKAAWTLENLQGTVNDGTFTVATAQKDQGGTVKASVGNLTGSARVRVVRSLPWREDFESYMDKDVPAGWVNLVAGKMAVATLDGSKVLYKEPNDTLFKRIRVFTGPTNWSNYTFEASVRTPEKRRQLGDIGITAQRYSLVLYGNAQKLRLEPWEPETQRTKAADFAWKADTWYRLKLRVENQANGAVLARGKAWPADQPEPAAWNIEKTDPIGNREGAPGLFIDAQWGAYIDNMVITKNQ
jgi:outer membrane protein assembly factor BamB